MPTSRRLPAALLGAAVLSLCALPTLARAAGSAAAATSPKDPGPLPAAADQTTLCSDGKSHFVAIAPDAQIINRLYYGDGKHFFIVDPDRDGRLTGADFYDPRFFAKDRNDSFRGLDMRFYSGVEVSKEKQVCTVRCGDRSADLPIVDPKSAKDILRAASYGPSALRWVPHRLARDEEGNYFYIDRGVHDKEKQFRLFVGPRGNMKQLTLTNTVSDSEGDIFSTKSGSLRLVVGRAEGAWLEKGKRKPLTIVPIESSQSHWKNLLVIYQDLGVYSGEPQGTPCDLPLLLRDAAH